MESSVCYVQLPNAGQKPALCFRGSKTAYAVINGSDGVIRTIEIDLKDYDKAQRVKSTKNGGEDYSPMAFAEAINRMAKSRSITARARLLLDQGAYLKPDDTLPAEEVISMPKNDDKSEDGPDNGETFKEFFSVPAKSKVRKLPKRINREGKAEDASPRKPVEATPPKRVNGSAGTPRQADPARKPAPILPILSKAAGAAKKPNKTKVSRRSGGKTLVSTLAAEAGLAQQPCRVKLRAAGFRAPYEEKNLNEYRKALGLTPRGKK